jgi:hypothetical protein
MTAPFKKISTWRERIGQTADFPLHVPTDVERAMVAEIADLRVMESRAADAPSEPSESVMRAALERIARWHGEFPDTGKTWPTGGAVSYAAEYGSNGERDYMRQIAVDALKSRAADAPSEPMDLRELAEQFYAAAESGAPYIVSPDSARKLFSAMTTAPVEVIASQPTAAAQQGSIGDDGEFLTLLAEYVWRSRFAKELMAAANAKTALVAYIDSRASAAELAVRPEGDA